MGSDSPSVMSVFDVEPRFIGGTETYARELSVQLERYGWRSVLCFVTAPSAEVGRFLSRPNVSIEILHRDVTRFGIGVIARLVRLLRIYKPAIAHFHYIDLFSLYPWVAQLCSGGEVFFTDHSSRPESHNIGRASLARRCIARVLNWPVSRVVCVSDYGQRALVERKVFPARRCGRIYNGVDLKRVEESPQRAAAFRRRFAIPDGRKIVMQVSWIIPEKGILDLLEAARLVVSECREAHFVVVGEGSFRAEYMRRGRELGLHEHLTWTGLVEDPFTAGVYDAADIVCQASRWEEVFGWVIAEAMAYRKPVIGTRVGGIPELIEDGESGFLVNRGDSQELARRVLALIWDPARRESMGGIGRKRVQAKFDLERNVAELMSAYGVARRSRRTGGQ